MRRVVVTGMGVVTPLGVGLGPTWANLIAGRSGTRVITGFDASGLPSRIAGEAPGFDPARYMDRRLVRRTDRFTQLAITATEEALAQSGLAIDADLAERAGVLIGSGNGGLHALMDQFAVLFQKGPDRISPFFITMLVTDLAGGQISIMHNLKGPNFAVTSACATGAHAIGEAAEIIRRDDADVMIAGGSEAPVVLMAMAAFGAMRALSTRNDDPARASRPFDAGRDGFVLAEGAGVVILEAEEVARARRARILAEVAGYGATGDAYHVTAPAPDGSGAARAMRHALRKAGLQPADIGYVNAHATSTFDGDRAEVAAIKAVFGEAAYDLPVSSTKGATGHMVGGGGAVETIFCIKSLLEGVIPPTINYECPDPDCDLDVVPNEARHIGRFDAALNNAFGFGGHNAALVLRRYEA